LVCGLNARASRRRGRIPKLGRKIGRDVDRAGQLPTRRQRTGDLVARGRMTGDDTESQCKVAMRGRDAGSRRRGDVAMRFMVLVKADENSGVGYPS
jgi:hypothetical protein